MFAIIKTGGKQYKVKEGDVLRIEKLSMANDNPAIIFDQVLLISDKEQLSLGQPLLNKAKVEASLVRNFKDKKVDVYKYKNKSRYSRKYGHRQQLTEVKIQKITA